MAKHQCEHGVVSTAQSNVRIDNQNLLEDSDPATPVVIATKRRDALILSIGDLTILSEALNPALSNQNWSVKKPEIMKYSLLPINQLLHNQDVWTEETIQARSKDLFKVALKLGVRRSSQSRRRAPPRACRV